MEPTEKDFISGNVELQCETEECTNLVYAEFPKEVTFFFAIANYSINDHTQLLN